MASDGRGFIEEDRKECCGKCKWHHPGWDKTTKFTDWMCANTESDYYTDWTDYEDYCEEWETRDE